MNYNLKALKDWEEMKYCLETANSIEIMMDFFFLKSEVFCDKCHVSKKLYPNSWNLDTIA